MCSVAQGNRQSSEWILKYPVVVCSGGVPELPAAWALVELNRGSYFKYSKSFNSERFKWRHPHKHCWVAMRRSYNEKDYCVFDHRIVILGPIIWSKFLTSVLPRISADELAKIQRPEQVLENEVCIQVANSPHVQPQPVQPRTSLGRRLWICEPLACLKTPRTSPGTLCKGRAW